MGIILLGLLLALFAPFSVEWAVDKLTFIPANLYQRFLVLVKDYVHPNVLAGSLVLLLPFPWHIYHLDGKKSTGSNGFWRWQRSCLS